MYRKDTHKKTYKAICSKYPHIKVDNNENLNIEKHTIDILRKCWDAKERFGHVADISMVTGISERTIFRYARENNFPKRTSY